MEAGRFIRMSREIGRKKRELERAGDIFGDIFGDGGGKQGGNRLDIEDQRERTLVYWD